MITTRRALACVAVAACTALTACSQVDPNDPPGAVGSALAPTSAPGSIAATPIKPTPTQPVPSAAVTAANGTVTCNYPSFGAAVRPVTPPQANDVAATGEVTLTLTMNAGDVNLTGDRAATPCSLNSFISLAKQGFFDGTQCHRLVDQGPYLLQCGDPSLTGRGGPGYLIADELKGGETYPAGTVAMANTGAPNTAGSQFFIVYQDSDLPAMYTVVGHVDAVSLAVVRQIAGDGQDGSDPNGGGKPKNDAQIKSVTVQQ